MHELCIIIKYFLDFKLNDKLKSAIKEASKSYDELCKSLNINFIEYDGFGKNLCKKQNISPDAIMQLGFQVNNFHYILCFD